MSPLVLLTGGRGFLGRHLIDRLLARGVDIRLVLRSGQDAPSENVQVLHSPDIFAEDAKWWSRACQGVDTIVHAAWYAVPGKYLYAPENLHCLQGTLALADGAKAARVRRFAGIGTCLEYDLSHRVLSTDTPLKPMTPYASCKAAAYLALSQNLPQAGMSFTWCRLFYLYGAGEDSRRLFPYIRQQLAAGQPAELTTGWQIRDFMPIEEAADQIVRAALGCIDGPVNICSGLPQTVRQLAERIADEYGRRDLLRFGARPANAVEPDCILGVPTPLSGIFDRNEA